MTLIRLLIDLIGLIGIAMVAFSLALFYKSLNPTPPRPNECDDDMRDCDQGADPMVLAFPLIIIGGALIGGVYAIY